MSPPRRTYHARRTARAYHPRKRNTRLCRQVQSYINSSPVGKNFSHVELSLPAIGSITNSWNETNLFTPPEGSGQGYRIGRDVRIHSIGFTGFVQGGQKNSVVGDDLYDTVRVILGVFDGSASAFPLSSHGLALNQVCDKMTMPKELIRKLYDRVVTCPIVADISGGGYASSFRKVSYYHKFKKPLLIKFEDDTNLTLNKRLILSCLSDSVLASHPNFSSGYINITYFM